MTPTPTKSRREIIRELAKFDQEQDTNAPTWTVDLDQRHADELREIEDDPDAEMSQELAAAIRMTDLEWLDAVGQDQDDGGDR